MQGSSQTVRCGRGASARYVSLVGLGAVDKAKATADWGASPYQTLGAAVAAAAKAVKAKSAAVALVGGAPPAGEAAAAAGKVANGLANGAYESHRFKTKPALPTLQSGAASGWHVGSPARRSQQGHLRARPHPHAPPLAPLPAPHSRAAVWR